MNSLRNIVRESIELAENVQQADKVYFNKGLLSQKVKEIILHITGGDAWTKLLSDIYYAKMMQWKKSGHWILAGLDGDEHEPEEHEYHKPGENDVMHIDDLKKIRSFHNQLKIYNKNIFPIKGLNVNGVADIWDLIKALNYREKILVHTRQLPSIAIRNLKNDIRRERNSDELHKYESQLESFLMHYSMISNRDEKFRKVVDSKMFKSNTSIEELLDFVDEKHNLLGGRNFTKQSIKRLVKENEYDMEIVYDSGNVMVVDVTSADAIKQIGCNSFWCFTYGEAARQAYTNWSNYSTNGHVYVLIDFSVSSDSSDFMHVLIAPLNFNSKIDDYNGDTENSSKLFDMSNDESDNALGIVNHLIGDKAPFILHFDEPVNIQGPTSKWPYENPNQTKLDLKELKKIIKNSLLNESSKDSDGIIYTIGNEENYDELLDERPLYKSKGGSAWKTLSAVKKYLKETGGTVLVDGWEELPAAIYTMEGDWDSDVDIESKEYGLINKKLKIIEKVKTNLNENANIKNSFSSLDLDDIDFNSTVSPGHLGLKLVFRNSDLNKIYSKLMQKDFKTDSTYIDLETRNMNHIHISAIPYSLRNIGLGKLIYRKVLQELGYITTGFVHARISEDAQRVWESLIKSGEYFYFKSKNNIRVTLAEKYGDLRIYEHILNEYGDQLEETNFDKSEAQEIDENSIRQFIKEQLNILFKNKPDTYLLEARKSKIEKLEDNKVQLTDDERKKVMDAGAVWHFSPGNKPSPAVWKSVDKNGKTTYVTSSHRAYQTRPTLKGAISIFHSFIKGTS